jgi:hypothetical protein
VREHVDLNELSNDIEGITTGSSANKKVDAVVEIVDLLVYLGLDLLLFVDVLFCCSAIFRLTVSVRLRLEFRLYGGVELVTGL